MAGMIECDVIIKTEPPDEEDGLPLADLVAKLPTSKPKLGLKIKFKDQKASVSKAPKKPKKEEKNLDVKKLFKCHCCEDTFKSQRSRRKHIENDHVDIHSKNEDQNKVKHNDLSSNHDNGNYVNNIKTEANDEFYFNLPLPTDMLQVIDSQRQYF